MEASLDQSTTLRFASDRLFCILCEGTGESRERKGRGWGKREAVADLQDFFTTRAVVGEQLQLFMPATHQFW